MRALRVEAKKSQARMCEISTPQILENELLIRAQYSSINYKDALAVTGKGAILKSFPLTPGIDVAGTIVESKHKKFKKGDEVLITGCECGESFDGGYADFVKASGDVVIKKPLGLTLPQTMMIGTAGFTAALAIFRMEQMDQSPQKGSVVVTGASGGVGSFAIGLLKSRGYKVIALSGKKQLHSWLRQLGADDIKEDLELGSRPLESAKYGGAIDNVGGEVLAKLSAHIGLYGNIACVGLASGAELKTTVMPLILRGVSLLGISSNNCPWSLREKIWHSLAEQPPDFDKILTQTISLEDILTQSENMLARKTHGRILVQL